MNALRSELDMMSSENAERLGKILRGLFACMQDMNSRLAVLERERGGPGHCEE